MKRLLNILIAALCLGGTAIAARTYVSTSVLSEGKFVKIRVSESGLHYLTYEDIKSAGLSPEKVRIYGYGGAKLAQDFSKTKIDDLPAVPFYKVTGEDGVFNAGDYLIFYAQGPIAWSYNGSRFVHTTNCYSLYGYYFLSESNEAAAEMSTASANGSATYTVSTYTNYQIHEVDSVNLVDRSGIEGGGQEFYELLKKGSADYSFTFPDIITSEGLYAFLDVAAYSSSISRFNLTCNGTTKTVSTEAIPSGDFYTKAKTGSTQNVFAIQEGEKQTLNLQYVSSANGSLGYINYLEVSSKCNLILRNTPLSFRNVEHYGTNTYSTFQLQGADSETQVWNISDLSHITRVSTSLSGSTITFVGSNNSLQEYIAFRPSMKSAMHKPVVVGPVANQNLHALQNIDYVVITPAEFKDAALRLAAVHEEVDHFTTAVVTDQEVYNEFSSGTPDATAYRWLMKMLYDRANSSSAIQAPKYLLLFGDGTFDNRKLLAASGNNLLLTYQAKNSVEETKAYGTDDYFGFLKDSEGESDISGRMAIAVGRIPVNNTTEANAAVNKTIDFIQQASVGKWKTNLCFLADDGDSNEHTKISDVAAEMVRKNNPEYIVNKIYLDAYVQETNAAGESYPLAQNKLNNLLSSGVLFMDYSGHGGYNAITSESMMTIKGIREMTNKNLGLWFLATCNFSSYDGGVTSAGEAAVLNEHGGAIATISACRTVYAPQNSALNQLFCDTLFAHSSGHYTMSIGDALRCAKNKRGSDSNKMPYVLLGDPAVRLAYPDDYRVETITKMDTLHALSIQTISGYIRTDEGDTASFFNGKLSVTIYDKMQEITTLDNDQTDEDKKVTHTYADYPSTLFKGETDVVDGKWSFTFMVPKDIRYNCGNGRITYYAYDQDTYEEAIGHYEDFLIGGSSTVEIIDTMGPDLNIYINTPSFTDGGKTYEYPHFYAEVSDENGINTAGSGIGHDLLLCVDGDADQTYVLNDYFTADNNSYQSGLVSYRFDEMAEGPHSLTFRAWDLVNNSSTAMLNFQVVKGYDPTICSVLTYPNPVSAGGSLNIVIDYDQPDQTMETNIYIYDMAGRQVYHFEAKDATSVHWNLGEANVHAGMYIYKVQMQSPTSTAVSKSGKIIVTE